MLPLLPGFEGNIEDNASSVMRVQLHWEYWTIIRSKKSLYRRLAHISNIDDYIKFYSVRAHGLSRDGEPLTEILYIHSKLIIVDDSVIILGSANINDRSMLGDRDSEIGIIVEDQDRVLTKHNHEVSKAAQKLRMELFKEHFGLTDEQAENYHD